MRESGIVREKGERYFSRMSVGASRAIVPLHGWCLPSCAVAMMSWGCAQSRVSVKERGRGGSKRKDFEIGKECKCWLEIRKAAQIPRAAGNRGGGLEAVRLLTLAVLFLYIHRLEIRREA